MKSKRDLLDLQFIEMRHMVVELAAFLDRLDRQPEPGDFRIQALERAIKILSEPRSSRAKSVLEALSDKSTEVIDGKAASPACGAPHP